MAVFDAWEARETYIKLWSQVIPKDIMHGCLNAYYEGSQWAMPLVCCVCLRWQHGVEMHPIIVNVNEEIPAYLSILHNNYGSPFSDNEFQFTDTGGRGGNTQQAN